MYIHPFCVGKKKDYPCSNSSKVHNIFLFYLDPPGFDIPDEEKEKGIPFTPTEKEKTLVSPPSSLFRSTRTPRHSPIYPSGPEIMSEMTHLDSVFPLGKVGLLLLRLQSLPCRLVLAQPPPDGTGSLGAEVERQVLLALVEDA